LKYKYIIPCPICDEEFATTRKSDIKWIKAKLREHLQKNHIKEVEEWYMKNRKNWRYVKNECLKPFKKKVVIGVMGGGKPLRAEISEEAFQRLKKAENLSELLSGLESICIRKGDFSSLATIMQAETLKNWVFVYFIEHVTVLKCNRLD